MKIAPNTLTTEIFPLQKKDYIYTESKSQTPTRYEFATNAVFLHGRPTWTFHWLYFFFCMQQIPSHAWCHTIIGLSALGSNDIFNLCTRLFTGFDIAVATVAHAVAVVANDCRQPCRTARPSSLSSGIDTNQTSFSDYKHSALIIWLTISICDDDTCAIFRVLHIHTYITDLPTCTKNTEHLYIFMCRDSRKVFMTFWWVVNMWGRLDRRTRACVEKRYSRINFIVWLNVDIFAYYIQAKHRYILFQYYLQKFWKCIDVSFIVGNCP